MKRILLVTFLLLLGSAKSQMLGMLIPTETATHTAVANGNWFEGSTWDTGTVPADAAIVYIPSDYTVTYEGASSAHIFAIRVDGEFICEQTDPLAVSTMTFDTFIGTGDSKVKFEAGEGAGRLEISIAAFDIEAHKAGLSGFPLTWNTTATEHYSDGALTYEVTYEVGPEKRFNTYADALAGDTEVTELSRSLIDDGPGVLGRYGWDSTQLSLGIITMGEIEIFGREKRTMVKLAEDAMKDQPIVELTEAPEGWLVGDEILITRGGNQGAPSNGEDVGTIQSIVGTTLTLEEDLNYNHQGRPEDTLHCYIGNLSRSIVFKSQNPDEIHHRGHFMAMHNPENIQVKNAVFLDMGRTDKSKVLDDFIWDHWLEPKVFTSKISPLGQECAVAMRNPKEDITNSRGRYSIHLHKTGAHAGVQMVYVTGNVVRGNPGWGITHHDSHAQIADNVVYDVTGSAIVSESGSETGSWDNNLVVWVKQGHSLSPYDAALFYEDYLYSGQGLGMKGRAVVCRGNVVANAKSGIGVMNMNPTITNQDRVDPLAITDRMGVSFNQFPLDVNGYSVEEDGVMPVEIALIVEDMIIIGCNQGLRSIERDMGVNHESRSIFEGFVAWGVNQGLSITYQADYSFKDVFISGKNMSSVGAFLWKHSHNHVFENVKMVDLGYGVTVSKLVVSGSGELKTRNNGFTPWYFIDLELDNVTEFYEILKEDPADLPGYVYDEHTDNPIHLSSDELHSRAISFTILDSTQLAVDYATADFNFSIDGIIADELGTYDMGIKQAWSQGTLRLDYPERLYGFASAEKLEDYLLENGVYKDTANDDQLYFILNEWLPDRRNYTYKKFPIRIKILNAPDNPLFAGAAIESPYAFYPQNHVLSRFATVNQSSTNTTITFDTASISVPAERAIDGNNNGRIIAQYYQQWLVPVGSLSETNVEDEPWYDLDLGELKEIEYMDIWNTVALNGSSIELPSSHFTNFYVLISDTTFEGLSLSEALELADYSYFNDSSPGRKYSINEMEAIGRYVRIQAVGTNKIAHAEVEIIGRKYVDICDYVMEGVDTINACNNYTWIDGVTYTESNNTATWVVETEHGCDSLVHLNLTINYINTSVDQAGNLLTAELDGGDYQWVDCDNDFAEIEGETNQLFEALENGTYAVIVSDGSCTDTSVCFTVDNIGLGASDIPVLNAYPNPNKGEFTLDCSGIEGIYSISIYNETGQIVMDQEIYESSGEHLIRLPQTPGVYHVEVSVGDNVYELPILIH